MPVPKAAVNEDDDSPARKNEIGATGQIAAMEAIPQPCGVQAPTQEELRLSVAPANTRHVEPTLLRGQWVPSAGQPAALTH